GLTDDLLLRTPHIPTDYWNPAYKVDKDIPKKSFISYTKELSNSLLVAAGKKVLRKKQQELSREEGTYYLLKELLDKYWFQTKDIKDKKLRNYYLYLIERELYGLLFLTGHRFKDRMGLNDFLRGNIL
ncbi:unnamed protein product, partial [marine sediment metagenome]